MLNVVTVGRDSTGAEDGMDVDESMCAVFTGQSQSNEQSELRQCVPSKWSMNYRLLTLLL